LLAVDAARVWGRYVSGAENREEWAEQLDVQSGVVSRLPENE